VPGIVLLLLNRCNHRTDNYDEATQMDHDDEEAPRGSTDLLTALTVMSSDDEPGYPPDPCEKTWNLRIDPARGESRTQDAWNSLNLVLVRRFVVREYIVSTDCY
jgi:hypothetical protein